MKSFVICLVLMLSAQCYGQLGDLNGDRFQPDSVNNPYGAGSRFNADSLNNPYGQYGSRFSTQSWTNPYATQPPQIYSGGQYMGQLSANRFLPDSTSNRFGRYGSPYSPDSINNRFNSVRYSQWPVYVYPGR